MEKRKTIYYEFWKIAGSTQELKKTGTRIVGDNSITTGIDTIPTATLTIPLEDLPAEEIANGKEPRMALYTVKIFYQVDKITKYTFVGTIDTMNVDYANYTVSMNLSHQVARMREWVMPAGYVVKNTTLSHVVGENGADLGYSSTMGPETQTYEARVNFEFRDEESLPGVKVKDTPIECSFSSTNKLEALNEALNNTESVHFMVDLSKEDTIVLGSFGDLTDVLVSPTPFYEEECNDKDMSKYVTMLTEPSYNVNYTNHFNRAVVFCGDVAEQVMHMTLKEVYENKDMQIEGFPVGIYNNEINLSQETEWDTDNTNSEKVYNTRKINNEKVYKEFETVAYANNDNREYYVTDQEQLDKDQVIKHTVFNFSDLYPIPELEKTPEGEEEAVEYAITDEDRKAIVQRAYWRAIRKLKSQRPERVWQFNSTPLPYMFQDGQKVTLFFVKKVINRDDDRTNEKDKTIVKVQDEFYLTKRTITFDDDLNEINTLTLDVELRPRDISDAEWELTELAKKSSGGIGGPNYPSELSGSSSGDSSHGTVGYNPSY